MADDPISYDKGDLRGILKAFKAMDEEATAAAKKESGALVEYLKGKITAAASTNKNRAALRVAQGSKVTKSSKIGELSIGFAAQKFSGGATTRDLWGGYEFGSNNFKQFPIWSGRQGRGSRGYYVYPTLRAEQPYLINAWENAFTDILKKWG